MQHSNPIEQFRYWFDQAQKAGIPVSEGMTLATVDSQGHPDARIVLLKEVREEGFVFFTNYLSQKGHQIAANPSAALVFWWATLERQVRVRGELDPILSEESDAYFKTRPRGSQIGAWASHQSEILNDRTDLEQRVVAYTQQFEKQEVPRPPHWGGYLLRPQVIEFWQGQESRLHDRFRYTRCSNGMWQIDRLSP